LNNYKKIIREEGAAPAVNQVLIDYSNHRITRDECLDSLVELVERRKDLKAYDIELIKNRILSEHKKHKGIDWAGIAARKIYKTLTR